MCKIDSFALEIFCACRTVNPLNYPAIRLEFKDTFNFCVMIEGHRMIITRPHDFDLSDSFLEYNKDMDILTILLIARSVMGVLDFIWLKYIAKNFYAKELGKLLLEKPNMMAAVVFYVIYVVGIVAFVVAPALSGGSLWSAVGYGALFGFVAYATYDLTNLATVKGFKLKVVLVDMCWGAFITAATAGITYFIISEWIV